MEALGYFTGMLMSMLLFFSFALIVEYIINGIFLMKIAEDYNIENKWMAFVPIANAIYIGKIAGIISNDKEISKKVNISIIAMFILALITGLTDLAIMSLFYFIAIIVYSIFYYICLYRIYLRYAYNNAVLFTVLSIIFAVAADVIKVYLIVTKIGKDKDQTNNIPYIN